MSNSSPVPLFGLLIGINNYKVPHSRWAPLHGPNADARSMHAWLMSLGVPSNHIAYLLNENATYNGIINSFRRLRDDTRIQRGDAIFIYYAGHGAEIAPPQHWKDETKRIQSIVPYDCECVDPDTGMMIPPIPDYFLGMLLGEIAEAKGNNITVVLDCCYSGSGTRGRDALNHDDKRPIARSVQLSDTFSHQLEEMHISMLQERPGPAYRALRQAALDSHVLLAACESDQLAHEHYVQRDVETTRRGAFTTALLRVLYNQPLKTLRYCDISNYTKPYILKIRELQGSKQIPQCEGNHTNRILFNLRITPPRQRLFAVRYREPTPRHYTAGRIIEAGLIHRINQMSKFSLYRASDVNLADEIGTLSITDPIGPLSSLSSVSFTCYIRLDEPIVALQRDVWNEDDLRIFIPPGNRFERLHKHLQQYEATYNPSMTKNPEEANIKADRISKDWIQFTLRSIRHESLPLKEWVHNVRYYPSSGRGDLFRILESAAHFYRELRCTNPLEVIKNAKIEISFYKLVMSTSEIEPQTNFGQIKSWGPVDPTANFYRNGIVSIPHDPTIHYGLKLHNRNPVDLYTHVFYFNNANLSISKWFSPNATSSDYRPDLRAQQSFTVGYGDSGTEPLICERNMQEAKQGGEVGYLRIYLSTQPVNLSYLPQDSPFEIHRGMERSRRQQTQPQFLNLIVPIVQRRRGF